MASRGISQRRSCDRCRKIRRRCLLSEFDTSSCVNCHQAKLDCSLPASRTTPSRDAKRKIEEIGDTPDKESIRSNRATLSTTAPHNPRDAPTVPAPKKPRYGKRARPASLKAILPTDNERTISANACGICLEETRNSGEKKGDAEMIQCEIKACQTWYHLSCLLFTRKVKMIFYSLHTGTKDVTFICPNCCNPEREDLANAVKQATSDIEEAVGRIHQIATAEKEGWRETLIPIPPQECENTPAFEHNVESLEIEEARTTYFEPARQERFEGFETQKINSLLDNIRDAVYDHDREICYAKELFHDGSDISMDEPLRAWDQIEPGQHFVPGREWFEVSGDANNLSESHAPITAALRRMLGTPGDKPLYISSDLMDVPFSQVHTALINWFVFDILNNELNIYLFPNMKPLRPMMTAVANFGDARWKGHGRQVLREVRLRAWHKKQFREEVVENVGWQGELIHRLDHFLRPLTRNIGKIDSWSQTRASIIKHTIELWTYLEAAMGQLEIIQPMIGAPFEGRICEKVDEDVHSGRLQDLEVKWVTRRGFRFREDSGSGSERPLMKKALVVVK